MSTHEELGLNLPHEELGLNLPHEELGLILPHEELGLILQTLLVWCGVVGSMDHAFMNNMNVHLLQHTLRSLCAGSSSSDANLNEKEMKMKKMKKMKKKKKNRHCNGNMMNEKIKAEDMKQASSSSWVYSVFWRILPRNYPPPKYVSVCVCICYYDSELMVWLHLIQKSFMLYTGGMKQHLVRCRLMRELKATKGIGIHICLPFLQIHGLKPEICVFVLILQLPWLLEILMVQDSGVGGWLL